MDGKVSVIVPIYNVEQYLRQCLDSIVGQTYENLEIILIDDGSPDNCGSICDEYAACDPRIVVIHKKNAGVHAAWNDGLETATGDWTAFVDSDDWLDLDYFEKLLNAPQAHAADVIQSNGYYWENGRRDHVRWIFLKPLLAKSKEERDELTIRALVRSSDPRIKGATGYVWGKLYRTSFLSAGRFRFDVQIRTGMMGDLLFNWDVFEKASLITCIPYCGYHYRITQGSGTFRFDPVRAKSQEHVEEQFYRRLSRPETSAEMYKVVESRCLRDIVHNLQHCYFHQNNPAGSREIAGGIREMKQMPYYKAAIYSRNNPYNDIKLKAFQFALKLPWVWPLRVMVSVWEKIDSQ